MLTCYLYISGTPVCTSLNDLKNQLKFIGIENVEGLFKGFARLMEHTSDRAGGRGRRGKASGRVIGHFLFFIRAVLIRHAQQQKYRGTDTTLMQLPPKTHRSVLVDFSEQDKKQYASLEKKALDWYTQFRKSKSNSHGKHFLKLTQKLTPMRVACAGGNIPIDDTEAKEGGDADDSETEEASFENDEEDNAGSNGKKRRKVVVYSDFAFQSKMKKLIEELSLAREQDPSSKSLVFSQYQSSLKYLQKELPRHGFQFRTLSGSMSMSARAKALGDFQKDPPTTIFLLSMRASACGINLTQANRVFLLEPGTCDTVSVVAVVVVDLSFSD